MQALMDIDLEVDQGELAVVLGPSGSGKTTLLNIIGALDLATERRVVVGGHVLTGASRKELAGFRRETVSFVFQSFTSSRRSRRWRTCSAEPKSPIAGVMPASGR